MDEKPTYSPRHLRKFRLAERVNNALESETARAIASLIDWATRIAWLFGGLAALIALISERLH